MRLWISIRKSFLMALVVLLVLSFIPISNSYADGIKRSIIGLEAMKTELLASNEEWIAFIGHDNNVWLVHPDGAGLTQITSDATPMIFYSNLKWAPDGEKLAYARVDISAGLPIAQILILDMESLLPTTVVESSYGGFDWFEGGTKLIYDKPIDPGEYPTTNYDWGKYDGLWAFSFDTGNSELVVAPYENNPLVNPRVSPDSSYILFDLLTLIGEGPWKNLGVYDRGDPADYIITELSSATCDWSPDGNSIACNNCTPYFCHPEIVLLNSSGVMVNKTTTEEDVWIDNPIWSPDGKYIAYGIKTNAPYAEGESSVNLVTADLSTSTYLTKGIPLDWSPSGNELLVLDEGTIFIVNIPDGERIGIVEGIQAAWQPITKPAISIELDITPGKEAGKSDLSWTVYCHDEVSCPKIESYDIRFSNKPINESNWEGVSELFGRRINANAFNTQKGITTPALETNKKWYFALKAIDSIGFESGLSNVVWIIDTGFRPLLNGYIFSNNDKKWDSYPTDQDFTHDDVARVFGEDVACEYSMEADTSCNLRIPYGIWYGFSLNSVDDAGHCLGMASTSLHLYSNLEDLRSIVPKIERLHSEDANIDVSDIRRIIIYYHVMQLTNPLFHYRAEQRKESSPISTLGELEEYLLNNSQAVLILDQGFTTHAITPFSISNDGSEIFTIWNYENQFEEGMPKGSYLTINKATNEWVYGHLENKNILGATEAWHGDEYTHSIYSIPLDYFYDEKSLPQATDFILQVRGNIEILISDNLGRHIGWMNGKFVDEIPDADAMPIINMADTARHPIYLLPANSTYSIEIIGKEGSKEEGFSLYQMGPNFSVAVDNSSLGVQAYNILKISSDGTQLSYFSNEGTEIILTHVIQGGETSIQSKLSGVDIDSEKEILIVTDLEGNQFLVNNTSGTNGNYDVEIELSNLEGRYSFLHPEIEILSSEIHTFNFESLSEDGNVILLKDRDGDGANDEITNLKNQVEKGKDVRSDVNDATILVLGGTLMVLGMAIGVYLVFRRKQEFDT